jgi:CDP-diacylglycerol--glycerol-3-phosphate 3-phosphatidyltransferase
MTGDTVNNAADGDSMSDAATPKQFKYPATAVMTPANILTFIRLALSIPFLVWMYYAESGWFLWGAFTILALSDVVDGIWARRAGPTTSGAFLDPLADKILAMGGFIVLGLNDYYLWLPIIIMAAREVAVSVARSVLARYRISLPARKLGKAKTFVQLLAVGFPIWPPTADLFGFNDAFLWFAAGLSVVSGIDLFVHAQREVQEKNIHLGDPFP